MRLNYRKDIQILRGIAVLLVVMYHLSIEGFQSGFLGVDVFFVISGFLMAVLYDPDRKFDFFRRRSFRLLPAYFVTIIVTIVVSVIIVTPGEYRQIFEQSAYATAFASNIGYWLQNSYFSRAEFNPLLHLWSLGVEIQFYILIPVLFGFLRVSKTFFWLFLLVSLALCFAIVEVSPKTSFFMMPLRLWEFLIGYGVAKYFTANGSVRNRAYSWIGSVSLLAIVAIPALGVEDTPSFVEGHPGLYALGISLATGTVIALGLQKAIEDSVIGNTLELLGEYSYSIYLVHFPVIVLCLYKPFSGTVLEPSGYQDLIYVLALTLVLSYASFQLVETKLRKSPHIVRLLFLCPFLVITTIYIGSVANEQPYSKKDLLVFDAFSDRDTYRCGKIFRILNPLQVTCEISEPSAKKDRHNVLLVGNSHADSIKHSFAVVANKLGAGAYFMVPNDPLAEGSSINVSRLIDEALSRKVSSIVLHYSRNSGSITKIGELVRSAGEYGIHVAFIMPVPNWSTHVPTLLWESRENHVELPSKTLSDYQIETQDLFEFFERIDANNLSVYGVARYFCNKDCLMVDSTGRPLYFDRHHLTLTGSLRLTPVFEEIIADSIRSERSNSEASL